MNTTPKDKFEKDAEQVRASLLVCVLQALETGNSREFLRLTHNYLAVGGNLEDIENITNKKAFEELTHPLSSEFGPHNTLFYANFYEKFKYVAIKSSDKVNFLGDACGLIDMFITIIETMGKRPEFMLPKITENSVLKYYVHLSLALLNHEKSTIFPECYYENKEVSELKDKLVRFIHLEAKQSVESVLRLTEKYEPGIEKMLKSVTQLMMIKGPKTYQEILHNISTNVNWNLHEIPARSSIIELQNYLKNGTMEDSAVPTSLYCIVILFVSKTDTFEKEFDAFSIKVNTLLLELCETEYRKVVMKKLEEKLMESDEVFGMTVETLKEVYQKLQNKDATKSFGDDLEKLTKSMMKYHKEKTYAKYLMEYY